MAGIKMLKIIFWLSVSGFVVAKKEDHTEEYEEFVVPFNGQKFDEFDWQLCTAVAETNPGNVLISPISVKFLLNMLYEGSSGETAKELEKILQLPENKNIARMKTSAVLRSLQTPDPSYVMEIGTKIFVDQSLTPKNWFQRILFLYYNAYIEKMNFTDSKASVERVNYWVESVTHGHVKDLITDGNFNQAVMLLVNAVYFKGTWKSFFQPEEGFRGYFEGSNGLKKVAYMKQTNYFYYSKSEDVKAQILRLPYLENGNYQFKHISLYCSLPFTSTSRRCYSLYEDLTHTIDLSAETVLFSKAIQKYNYEGFFAVVSSSALKNMIDGQKFAMYVILPNRKNGLEELIKDINPFVLRKHIWHMEETSVEVILPKFKFQYKSDLKDVLRKVGLNKIFDSYGEMKGLIQNKKSKNLVVSNVIQKAGIEVNEEGSVAAAATEMQLINKIGVQDELFNASHPFLFFIEDETTGTVVFVGKFMHPETEVEDTTPQTTTTFKPQTKHQKITDPPKRMNSSQGARRTNSPKLFDLKQKKIKTELRGLTLNFNGNLTTDEIV